MSSSSTEAPPTLTLTTFIERVHRRIGEHDQAPLSVAPAAELTDLAVSMEALEARFAAAKLAVIGEIDRSDPHAVTQQRKITRRLRRTVETRDRGCACPGCDRPPSWTDAHHIVVRCRGNTADPPA